MQPADFSVEKIAYSAFYMTRLEWVLRKHDVKKLYCAGIVTNGGVASTVRDAHVRDFDVTVLEDGCAAFSEDVHRAAIEGLRPVARIATIDGSDARIRDIMSRIKPVSGVTLDAQVPLLIIGAGAAGLCAALAAKEAGVEPLVIERDAVPAGSTSLSAGLIPAADTRFQRAKGIADSPELFAADIQRKANNEADAAVVAAVAQGAGPLIEWLTDRYGLPFDVIDNFNYPGHSALRMHGLPTRTGLELINRLRSAAEASGISIVTERAAETLLTEPMAGFAASKSFAATARASASGARRWCWPATAMAAIPILVRRHIPEMASALYFGHPGNRGDAVCGARRSARNWPISAPIKATARSRRRIIS